MIFDRPHLVMYDEKRKPRVDLFVTPDGPRLEFVNEAGTLQTLLTAYKGRNGLLTYNRTGTLSTVLTADETAAMLWLYGTDGKPHIELWITELGSRMAFLDAEKRKRPSCT
jgi:hypothetical protein